jgi:DNA-binding NarL/FixJ family response regulator
MPSTHSLAWTPRVSCDDGAECAHVLERTVERRLSLLHIEDDSFWRTVISAALSGLPHVAQVQTAPRARDGLAMAAQSLPDIVLLDLQLPDGDGLTLARELMLLPRAPRIVLLSVRQDAAVLHAASEPHIAGLLWKFGDVLGLLPSAIETVAHGGKFHPPEVREALRRFRCDPNAFFKVLSDGEINLLPYWACGASDAEIADARGISTHTVKSHRYSVMRKLNLHSTARLIHWAIVSGFGRVPPAEFQSTGNVRHGGPLIGDA